MWFQNIGLEAYPSGVEDGVDSAWALIYHIAMIETIFFVFGVGFSILVYFLSIKRRDISAAAKAGYFLLTLIGITGMVFLIGVAIADRIRSL